MDQVKFIAAVLDHRKTEEKRVRGLSYKEAREIAPGVIIVLETDKRETELLIIFDGERWIFQHPKPACRCPDPRIVDGSWLRIFRCLGGFPPARDFRAAVGYAKSHLKPKDGFDLVWHQLAVDIDLAA